MEVTKSNFCHVIEEIKVLLPKALMVSFDTEFTGLRDSSVRENWEDTLEERYCQLRKGCSEFALIQYGICFFVQKENEPLTYSVHPFNFYLFPSYPSDHKVSRRLERCFRCQPSSLTFLSSSDLDFNKWIKEGISYMRESDEEWWRNKRKESSEPLEEEFDVVLGFSKVFKMISESKLPVVGHCILLDILHSYSHFIDELPEALSTFKAELTKRLPSLYDTILICANDTIRDKLGTSLKLAKVYESLLDLQISQIKTEFPKSCSHYGSENHFHEAAYDAYISGYIFLLAARMLGGDDKDVDPFSTLESYRNRVYLYNCECADSLNFAGPEMQPSRDHIFYLTFPKEVTTEDIKNLFSPFGGCRISWINDTNARVSLHHRNKAEEAYKAVANGSSVGGKFTISRHTCTSPPSSNTPSTVLGKRKDSDTSLHEGSDSPACKQKMFEENIQW